MTFVNIAYITRKIYSKEKLYFLLSKLFHFLTIIENGAFAVKSAIELEADDFEDAVQYYAACQTNVDYIITRNKKDFSFSKIEVLTPKEYMFLRHII